MIDMEYVQNKLNIIDYIIDVPKEENWNNRHHSKEYYTKIINTKHY